MKLLLLFFVALAVAATYVAAEPEAEPEAFFLGIGRRGGWRGGRGWGWRGGRRWGGRRYGRGRGRGFRRRWGRSADDEMETEEDKPEENKVALVNPFMYSGFPYTTYNAFHMPYYTHHAIAAPVKQTVNYNTITTHPVAYAHAPLYHAAAVTHPVVKREAEPEPLFGIIGRALRGGRGWGRGRYGRGWGWGNRRSWRGRGRSYGRRRRYWW